MNSVIVFSCAFLNAVKGIAVFKSKAFVDATNNFAYCLRNILTCFFAVFLNSAGKISHRSKFRCIGVNEAFEGFAFKCKLFKLCIRIFFTFSYPLTAAFLNKPETANIFKESGGEIISTLVCNIKLFRCFINDWFFNLCAEQRPCSAADESKIIKFAGCCGDSALGIVSRNADNISFWNAKFFTDFIRKLTDNCTCGCNICKKIFVDTESIKNFFGPVVCF